ncbi:MAG: hypothetical protein K8S62_14820 [Candidatus Sabulitectum sp.]|nr:hypothetical protein [Candidatus Sabulitectum sp.]
MKTILLTVLLLFGSVLPEAEESSSSRDGSITGLFDRLMNLTFSETRSWARPIERVDMDRMVELMEAGFVTFHAADWYAVVDEGNE